jgi:Ca2+-transporting ATPase
MFLLRAILLNLLQGLGSLAAVMAVYSGTLYYGLTVESARAMAFAVLVISNLGLILSNRARGTPDEPHAPNSALWWVVSGALAGLILVIYAPSVSALFSFTALSIPQLLMAFAAGAGCMLWYELLKSISASRRAAHA